MERDANFLASCDSVKNHLLNELNNLVNSNETLNLDNIKHNTTIKEAYKKL